MEYYYGGDEHGIVAFLTDERPLQVGEKAQLLVSPKLDTVTRKRYFFGRRHGRIAKVDAGARQSFLIWPGTVGKC